MKKYNISIIIFEFLAVIISVLFFKRMSFLNEELYTTSENRIKMNYVADLLENSSSQLTNFARNYVVTKDKKYHEQYYKILAIRDGELERPFHFNSLYWDLNKKTREINHPKLNKKSISELILELPFTNKEIKKLKLSEANSNKLVSLELEAFNAIEGRFKNTGYNIIQEPNQKLAIDLLYSKEYSKSKHKIMKPIDEFHILLNKRMKHKIDSIEKDLKITFMLFFILAFIYIIINFFVFRYINNKDNKLEEFNLKLKDKSKELEKINSEQKQLLSLFNDGDVSLFKWRNDKDFTVEHLSENVEKIFGYTKKDFLNKEILYTAIVDRDDLRKTFNSSKLLLERGEDFFPHRKYKIKTKNNEIKWVLDNTLAIRNENNEITHYLGYITEITQLIELEENNLKQRDFIQQQAKLAAMGEMMGAIAHQWRQPLNELFINIQNLKYDYEDQLIDKKFIQDFIETSRQTIKFMSKTIDDFRNFFRIDKEKRDFDVKEIISQALSLLSAQLKNNYIEVKLLGNSFRVHGFIGEFQQVILNLINNSKDAFIEKNIKDAKIEIILKDSKFIIIRDNAGGIPKDIVDRIFEPYFTTKEQGKGTGMGLYMSKMIIENMDGSITVNNIENGTEFTITMDIIYMII